MYRHKYAVFGAVCALAVTVACSNTGNPISPNAAVPGSGAAGPAGETLKIAAPSPVSPVNGARAEVGVILVLGNVTGQYASFPVTYRYEIRNAAGTTVLTGTQAAGSGSQTTIPVGGSLAFDTAHTWRARAEYAGAFGPWSAAAAFKTPAGSFIRGNEVLDLLNDGKTVGQVGGSVSFLPGIGLRMNDGTGYVAYALATPLTQGEFSFMATNVDEGNPGDKSKVMSMGEICGDDVTDNDYRMSLEVRGSIYPIPGAIQYRVITGDAREEAHRIRDSGRPRIVWNRTDWYFFKMSWRDGSAGFEIRNSGPNGSLVYAETLATSGHAYRPIPHCVYIGAPPTRAGVINQTHPGQTVKNVWISGNSRPLFPAIIGRPE
ncbi:MAG: hypothetical protein M3R55_00140 [Acidobacteriota bacterium]|nr:hypothetical protein [Acidobacteriota bacterium]